MLENAIVPKECSENDSARNEKDKHSVGITSVASRAVSICWQSYYWAALCHNGTEDRHSWWHWPGLVSRSIREPYRSHHLPIRCGQRTDRVESLRSTKQKQICLHVHCWMTKAEMINGSLTGWGMRFWQKPTNLLIFGRFCSSVFSFWINGTRIPEIELIPLPSAYDFPSLFRLLKMDEDTVVKEAWTAYWKPLCDVLRRRDVNGYFCSC